MSKNIKHIKPREREKIMDALMRAANSMPKNDPVMTFVTSVLTESEQVLIGRRLLIAQMILAGKKQMEIMHELNVSPNTFTRTRKWLTGQIPEYDKALKEFHAHQKQLAASSKSTPFETTAPFSLARLRKKYPAHFFLLSLIEKPDDKTD